MRNTIYQIHKLFNNRHYLILVKTLTRYPHKLYLTHKPHVTHLTLRIHFSADIISCINYICAFCNTSVSRSIFYRSTFDFICNLPYRICNRLCSSVILSPVDNIPAVFQLFSFSLYRLNIDYLY